MEAANTAQLVAAFMEASTAAEAEPSSEQLRSMLEICAALSRLPDNAWATRPAVEGEIGAEAQGLDEVTGLPGLDEVSSDAELGLTAGRRVCNLVREARVFVRLSLYDLAEGAVSRAIMLLERIDSTSGSSFVERDDPITGVMRVTDLRDAAIWRLLTVIEQCELPTVVRFGHRDGVWMELRAAEGGLCFGAWLEGSPFVDQAFADAAPELHAELAKSENGLGVPGIDGLAGPQLEACRQLMVRALELAGELILEAGSVPETRPSDQVCDLAFSPASLYLAATRVIGADQQDNRAVAMFRRHRGGAQSGWLLDVTTGAPRLLDLCPETRAKLSDLAVLQECAAPILRAAGAYGAGSTTILLHTADGFWLVMVDRPFVALLRIPSVQLGRAIWSIVQFDAPGHAEAIS